MLAEAGRRVWARGWGLPPSACRSRGQAGGGCAGCPWGHEGHRARLGRLCSWPCHLLHGQRRDAEQTWEAHLAPGTTQETLAQRLPCVQACRGGDAGSGLRPRAEVWGWGTLGHHEESRASSPPLPAQSWLPALPALCPTLALLCAVCLAICACRFVFQVSFPAPRVACAPIWGHAPLLLQGDPPIHPGWG